MLQVSKPPALDQDYNKVTWIDAKNDLLLRGSGARWVSGLTAQSSMRGPLMGGAEWSSCEKAPSEVVAWATSRSGQTDGSDQGRAHC